MNSRRALAALAAFASLYAGTAAAQSPDLRSLFPQRAPVVLDQTGDLQRTLARLDLSADVLRECRSDLSDLRLLAEAPGQEAIQVPYLLDDDRSRGESGSLELRRRIEPQVVDLFRQRVGSGSSRQYIERIVIEVPAIDSMAGSSLASWDLIFASRRARFVRRVSVIALGSDGTRTTLIDDGSIFRLAQPQYERISLELPAHDEARLEITLEGRDRSYLEPSLFVESRRQLRGLDEARIRLEIVEREDTSESTRLIVERPSGLRPGELEISTSSALFERPVEIRDGGSLGGAILVGSATLFRLEDDITIERLRVDVGPARGDRLEITIDNGDSPPLADLVISALLRQPSLVFDPRAARAGSSGSDLRLYFGGARAHRPRYDIAGLIERPTTRQGERAEVAARLLDVATSASLGDIEDNPLFDRSPPLAFAMRAGAELNRRRYSKRRTVIAQPSAEGLSRLDVGLEDLAAARPDLADLRLVDDDSRQWAYLFGNQETSIEATLTATRKSEDHWSVYRVALPATPAKIHGLVLDTAVPFFDRRYRIEARVEGRSAGASSNDRSALQSGRLLRSAPDNEPIEITWSPARVSELVLLIEDGDDQPLELGAIQGRFPTTPVYFVAPAGNYQLLLGYPDDQTPQYELRRARDLVLALDAGSAQLGPLEDNPDFRRSARAGTAKGAQGLLLWSAVLLAVAVLTVLTLRLARSTPQA